MSGNGNTVFTGERIVEGGTPERIWLDHIARYDFAAGYVRDCIVLDVACGTGYGSLRLCDGGARRVIGVDFSTEAIEFARAKYKRNGVEFGVGDIADIDFPNGSFDVVVSFETIEHISSREEALLELRRVLRPGGTLIISSPNRKMTSPFTSFKQPPQNVFHVAEYTMKELTRCLQTFFEVLEVYGQRAVSKIFLLPLLERVTRRTLPTVYDPSRGKPELEKVSWRKEYRYITVVCRKANSDKP